MDKVNACLACYTTLDNEEWVIGEAGFQWDEKENVGLGHAEGAVLYDAVLENNEKARINGPFKFYLSNEDGYWNIFYFQFPGFTW
jgi:hypothetical protein